MTSPQNAKQVTNLLYPLVSENFRFLPYNIASFAKNYLRFEFSYPYKNPLCDNYICLDGSSDFNIAAMIREFDKHKDELKLPNNFDKTGTTMFYNNAEGWCSNDIFYVIEWLIDTYGLTGDCYYTNISCNNQEMYDLYLERNNKERKLKQLFFSNEAFINDKHYYYSKPIVPIKDVPLEEKKLYSCFNWNARPHRFGILSYLNYLNLIDDGYITSPGIDKYSYNPTEDYNLLIHGTSNFFKNDVEVAEIVEKLKDLKDRYPFKIDDRSIVKDTDTLIYDPTLKAPMWEARTNSLFEIVPETFFTGEHMFSEKIFTPIVVKKPFLFVGSYKGLESLRKLGFKTFEPFIDESYDLCHNGQMRIKMIVNQILKLKRMRDETPKEFYQMYNEMKEILDYNYTHFMGVTC